jgi:hypothetical protein
MKQKKAKHSRKEAFMEIIPLIFCCTPLCFLLVKLTMWLLLRGTTHEFRRSSW